MDNLMLRRRILLGLLKEEYIVFVDPYVEAICVANWGDGIGLKPSQAAVVTTMTAFKTNTDIVSFDELHYFTGIPASDTSKLDFSQTTKLKYITIPSQIQRIGSRKFANSATYASLERITFENDYPITFDQYAFQRDSTLQAVHIKDLDNWLHNTYSGEHANPLNHAHHLYLNGTLVTSITLPSDMTTIPESFMQGMQDITSFTIPSRVTSIGDNAFRASGLSGDITVPSSVTTMNGHQAFTECPNITNLYIHSATTNLRIFACSIIQSEMVGDGTGELHIYGDATISDTNLTHFVLQFKKIIIDGNYEKPGKSIDCAVPEQFRIGGNYTYTGGSGVTQGLVNISGTNLKFIEIMGTITSSYSMVYGSANIYNGAIIHLGYDAYTNNAVPCAPTIAAANSSRVTKIYVGKGNSAAEDNNILSVYLNDSAWSQYSSKLDTWYNYSGDYKD